TPDREGKLSDLTDGTPVGLQLSVFDRKTVLSIRVQGASVQGTLKGVDVGNSTITVTVKEDAQVVDKTYSVDKDARIDGGKLGDLTAGTAVALTLSVFDKTKVVAVRVVGK